MAYTATLNDSPPPKMDQGRSRSRKKGCYISQGTGIILVILAVGLAIAVGILVHYTSKKGSSTECHCMYGGTVETLDSEAAKSQIQFCNSLGEKSKKCLGGQQCKDVKVKSSSGDTPSSGGKKKLPTDVRIPTKLYPLHYNVELKPDIYSDNSDSFNFQGEVEILLECKEPADKLYLHINKLQMDNSTISFRSLEGDSPSPGWSKWTHDEERQFFILHLTSQTDVGKRYVFKAQYSGPLKDDLVGLYRSSYIVNNQTKWLVASQLQATDARKTFPCFDEPAIKATFNITLLRKESMKSLSNMPIFDSSERTGGWMADHFEKTVKMSTYLLAFVVCDFTYKEQYTARGTRFRVWARREAVEAGQVDYALDIGVRILTYFEDYFNIPFPLPKQDMIAVPDFQAGAMENWGLIIYRETALLYDPVNFSTSNKQRVAVVVSHELAHQWFGNLVTPTWWDDLWLNEGFASYIENLGIEHVHPDWKMMDLFVESVLQSAFVPDGLASSHPIFIPVHHPDEIVEIFDLISYRKGASVIRMMDSFLGRSTFQQGLTNYLNGHAYDVANHTDLWRALGEQAKREGNQINVPEVMDTWVLQMGYPVVTVSVNRQTGTAEVRQKHFLMDDTKEPDPKYPSPFGYKWMIPFTYTTDANVRWENPDQTWMRKNDVSITGLPSNIKWIIGNIGQSGYYRMNYDLETWNNIIQQLSINHQIIPVKNRAQLVDDCFVLGTSGMIDQLLALEMTKYLKGEVEYIPWAAALNNIGYIRGMLSKTGSYGAFQKFMVTQLKPVYDEIGGWASSPQDSHQRRKLRIELVNALCRYGNEDCLNEASTLYGRWMEDPTGSGRLEPDLRSATYCYGIQNGGYPEWEFAFNKYMQETSASEKIKLLYGMSCTDKPWILNKYLDLNMNSTYIRKQDTANVFIYTARNTVGSYIVWDAMQRDFKKVYDVSGGLFSISRVVKAVTSKFNTEYGCQQISNLMRDNAENLGSANRAFQQSLEQCYANVKWVNTNMEKLSTWLNQQV